MGQIPGKLLISGEFDKSSPLKKKKKKKKKRNGKRYKSQLKPILALRPVYRTLGLISFSFISRIYALIAKPSIKH